MHRCAGPFSVSIGPVTLTLALHAGVATSAATWLQEKEGTFEEYRAGAEHYNT